MSRRWTSSQNRTSRLQLVWALGIGVGAILCCLVLAQPTLAEDWPAWRHDAQRSSATGEQLPEQLSLVWERDLPRVKPAWAEDPRLYFDSSHEPIVVGQTMLVGTSYNDSLTAFDLSSGKELWRVYADAPIRCAPVAVDGRVYFGSDDGCLYVAAISNGELLGKYQVAVNERHVLGNERLVSVWPLRGGMVYHDGRIHMTSGVWPFEGVFLHSFQVDGVKWPAFDGKLKRAADAGIPGWSTTTLRDVEAQGHVSPQGYLAIGGDRLYIPSGREVVTCKNLATGKFENLKYSTRGLTDHEIAADERFLFHGHANFDRETKMNLNLGAHAPILSNDVVYFAKAGAIYAYDLKSPETKETKDRRGRKIKQTALTMLWKIADRDIHEVPADPLYKKWLEKNPLKLHIKAGNRLYASQAGKIVTVDLDGEGKPKGGTWSSPLRGTFKTILAANGHLVVATGEGRISCFGAAAQKSDTHWKVAEAEPVAEKTSWTAYVESILEQEKSKNGYCVVYGFGTGELVQELLRQTDYQVVVVEEDRKVITANRDKLDAQGMYGTRVSAVHSPALTAGLPQYMANLVVSENAKLLTGSSRDSFVRTMYQSVRPYGGVVYLPVDLSQRDKAIEQLDSLKLPQAEVGHFKDSVVIRRSGRLPGSADWTHEYGDSSNTLMSHDRLVKAPMGVLWYGGPASSGDLFYNRHYWGPSMAVIGGRMFIQGPSKLSAIDVYTGRIMWIQKIEDDGNYHPKYLGRDKGFEESAVHRPGRRGNDFEGVIAGFHFLAVEDAVYLVHRDEIFLIDPVSGEITNKFKTEEGEWGRIRVHGDLILATIFKSIGKKEDMPVKLVAMDRHSGKEAWTYNAKRSVPVIAVSADTVYCFDGHMESYFKDWKRRGLIPKAEAERHLIALDLNSGKEKWKYTTDLVVTWLSYSQEHDTLLASNRESIATFNGKDGSEKWKKYATGQGFKGHPENLWDKVIIWNDQVLDQRGPGLAYSLETGEPITRKHPITKEPVPWEFTKTGHHCNYAIASPHLMTFRAHTSGFLDLESGTTSRLNGFRSGCRNSLIPANGVLNAPNFAHGCVCGFSLFTSLALTHLPEAEMWTYSSLKLDQKKERVKQVGVNLGAPGDRLASNGTMWLAHPNKEANSPKVKVNLKATAPRYFRQHSSLFEGSSLPWVGSSGVEGAESIEVVLHAMEGDDAAKSPQAKYKLKLHFVEPDQINVGERIFDVVVGDQPVVEELDIMAEAGGSHRVIVKEIPDLTLDKTIVIQFRPRVGLPIISGVELVADSVGTDSAGAE